MNKIEIFGPGCANCQRLEQHTKEALANHGLNTAIAKVEDMMAIADAGVMRTPAMAIDGRLVLQGRVPGVQELERILVNAASTD